MEKPPVLHLSHVPTSATNRCLNQVIPPSIHPSVRPSVHPSELLVLLLWPWPSICSISSEAPLSSRAGARLSPSSSARPHNLRRSRRPSASLRRHHPSGHDWRDTTLHPRHRPRHPRRRRPEKEELDQSHENPERK